MADTNLQQLVINELTKAQYEALTPEANQLYLVTDEVPLDSGDIDTSLSSSSTDSKVPSSKCVYDALAGKAASNHNHDDRYYTESEVNTLLSGKAPSSHTHDDRYYTESEIDTALSAKEAKGYLTIGGTQYEIEITSTDPGVGTAGKIIIVTG